MASSRCYMSQIRADQQRSRTRVNIGQAFERWCQLKEEKGLKSHAEVAAFLLDRHDSDEPLASMPLKKRKVTLTPAPALLSILGALSPDRIDWEDSEVQSEVDSTEIDSSADEDYVPGLCICFINETFSSCTNSTGGALKKCPCIETLPFIGVDETVHDVPDHAEPPPLETDTIPPNLPPPLQVQSEEDLIGKRAFIVYEDNLQQLASFLVLPVSRCPYICRVFIENTIVNVVVDWILMYCSFCTCLCKEHTLSTADGRMDSPGHCAQYCTYTVMDNKSKDIVSILTVDKRQTDRNSVIMEKKAFVDTMTQLITEVKVVEMCTDAHVQISALMDRRLFPGVKHSFDMWHGSKNLAKKISADLWLSLLHHVVNGHCWVLGRYQHEALETSSTKQWLKKGSKALEALQDIMMDKRWLKRVDKYLTFRVRRLYKKNARRWSVYAVKEVKKYDHIPSLQVHILSKRLAEGGLPLLRPLRPEDPRRLGLVPAIPPPPVEDLLQTQAKRGLGPALQQK
ncbi:hypothetical protein ABVT39_007412 [Epinephelus coioides]